MSEQRKPWAYVAHKPGRMGGVTASDIDGVSEFCADFIAHGYTITPVYDRAEYETYLHGTPTQTPEKDNG